MSLQYPSIPLTASDAKLLADDAILQAKKVATDAWLTNASASITAAARAGLYSLTLAYDAAVVNRDEIIKQLNVVLGYTTTDRTTTLDVEWQSVQRDQVTPLPDSNSNFGYQAN